MPEEEPSRFWNGREAVAGEGGYIAWESAFSYNLSVEGQNGGHVELNDDGQTHVRGDEVLASVQVQGTLEVEELLALCKGMKYEMQLLIVIS